MKAFAKRKTLLVVLVAFAAVWVLIMSLGTSRRGSAQGADGSQAVVKQLDDSEFPRVTAYLSLLDQAGQPIEGLANEAFSLAEDGIEVPIEIIVGAGKQPIVTMLTLDHSGSMDQSGKMDGAQQAAHAFLDQLQIGRDRVGIIAFDNTLSPLSGLKLISEADRQTLKRSISSLQPAGGTAYYDAVYSSISSLAAQPGRKVVIAMTDGQDNRSNHSVSSTIDYAKQNKIAIYTIGLGNDVNARVLERMAKETGGEYHFSPDASQLAELYQKLAQSLQNEYSLTYQSPTPRRDGAQRNVAVTVQHPGATLKADGIYNPGGVLSVSLNLPLLAVLAALLVGLAFLPGLAGAAGRKQMQTDGVQAPARPQVDYRAPVGYVPPSPPPPTQPPQGYPPSYSQVPPTPPVQPTTTYPPPRGQVANCCVYCGRAIRPGARFCGSCGRAQPAQP